MNDINGSLGANARSCGSPAGCEPSSGEAPSRTIAWLLEWPGDDNMPTRYWHPKDGWMLDANKGCWFARKADAEGYKAQSRMHGTIVGTEHVFGLSLAREGGEAVRAHPNDRCSDCFFEDNGSCRRLPPATVPSPVDNQHPVIYWPSTCWPQIAPEDWCGEFRERAHDHL